MRHLPLCLFVTAALGLAGCSSADTIAANRAAEAQLDLEQGRLTEARKAIGKALAARDNVVDYWLLKAHIDLKAGNRDGAFGDYEFAIQLDRTNMEALQALCQLGLAVGSPDAVDRYADQLLLLMPGSVMALAAKGVVALSHGDTDTASGYADRVLTQDPQNLAGLSLKAHVLLNRDKFADAAALIEKTLGDPVSNLPKLKLLSEIYTQSHDQPSYDRTLMRMAAAAPNDPDIQIKGADLLYKEGQIEQARGIIRRIMGAYPANFGVATAVLNEWMQIGPKALDNSKMLAEAAPLSLLMKADYAQFANENGHPDLAIAILRGADHGSPTPDNSNAKAALAYALGTTGHIPAALAQLNTILDGDHDPNQPWALLARARLLAASHDYINAVRDARLLVANDRENATARLALADILQASGSADLSESALREGLRAMPRSTRLATRLAATLAAQGKKDQAAQIARDLLRAAPVDRRAQALAQAYGAALAQNITP